MTSYGAIDGFQASESDHPPSIKDSIPSTKEKLKDLLARPWVRGAAAFTLILIVALRSHPFASKPSSGTATDDSGHGEWDENQELFYDEQLVNHFNVDTTTWSHRYWKSINYFKGPGHPIFLVVGGEGELVRMLYPFVNQHLAPHFGAAVIQPEHR